LVGRCCTGPTSLRPSAPRHAAPSGCPQLQPPPSAPVSARRALPLARSSRPPFSPLHLLSGAALGTGLPSDRRVARPFIRLDFASSVPGSLRPLARRRTSWGAHLPPVRPRFERFSPRGPLGQTPWPLGPLSVRPQFGRGGLPPAHAQSDRAPSDLRVLRRGRVGWLSLWLGHAGCVSLRRCSADCWSLRPSLRAAAFLRPGCLDTPSGHAALSPAMRTRAVSLGPCRGQVSSLELVRANSTSMPHPPGGIPGASSSSDVVRGAHVRKEQTTPPRGRTQNLQVLSLAPTPLGQGLDIIPTFLVLAHRGRGTQRVRRRCVGVRPADHPRGRLPDVVQYWLRPHLTEVTSERSSIPVPPDRAGRRFVPASDVARMITSDPSSEPPSGPLFP